MGVQPPRRQVHILMHKQYMQTCVTGSTGSTSSDDFAANPVTVSVDMRYRRTTNITDATTLRPPLSSATLYRRADQLGLKDKRRGASPHCSQRHVGRSLVRPRINFREPLTAVAKSALRHSHRE